LSNISVGVGVYSTTLIILWLFLKKTGLKVDCWHMGSETSLGCSF